MSGGTGNGTSPFLRRGGGVARAKQPSHTLQHLVAVALRRFLSRTRAPLRVITAGPLTQLFSRHRAELRPGLAPERFRMLASSLPSRVEVTEALGA